MTRILVVDDCSVDRTMVGGLIRRSTDWTVRFAADGREAVDEIDRELPDLVITDMQMPHMDGLALVNEVVQTHPGLPIMLITSQGSEEIAMKALSAGAASYSPKRLLGSDLVRTARGLLGKLNESRRKAKVKRCMIGCSFQFSLENDTSLIPPLVEMVQSHLSDWDDSDQLRIGVALDEALVNAMHHGNLEVCSSLREDDEQKFFELVEQRSRLEPYRERRVRVVTEMSLEEFQVTIEDDGPGYNPESLPDPACAENLDKVSGRGLLLIRTFMDEVEISERGNQIRMRKQRVRQPEESVTL